MTDHESAPAPAASTGEPASQAPRRVACPRCRGTFEGNPDFCPHCGFSKADAAALNAQARITPPVVPEPAVTEPAPAPSPPPPIVPGAGAAPAPAPPPPIVPDAAPAEAAPAPAPPTVPAGEPAAAAAGTTPRGKPLWPWLVGALVLLAVGGTAWWMATGGVKDEEAEDPCAVYQQELEAVQNQDHPNSREERRAMAEVTGRALDAGCDLGEPPPEGERV